MSDWQQQSRIAHYGIIALVFIASALVIVQVLSLWLIGLETYLPGPVQDSWGLMPYLEKNVFSNSWFNAELFYPQNSHRYPFLKLSFLIDFYYFNASNLFLVTETALLIIGSIAIYYFILSVNKNKSLQTKLIFIIAASFACFPTLSWTLSHLFNLHMLQCAFFSLLACTLIAYSFQNTTYTYFLFSLGIIAAIACNLSAFTLSSLWPAILFLLWLNHASKKQFFITSLIFIFTSYFFIAILPVDNTDNGKNFQPLIQLFLDLFSSNTDNNTNKENVSIILFLENMAHGLKFSILYLIQYLSLPKFWNNNMGGSFISYLVTAGSLLWFIFHCFTRNNKNNSFIGNLSLSLMLFVFCMAITTAIGRGFMGELSYGLRFHPMVLLYWSSFFIHLLFYFYSRDKILKFYALSGLAIIFLLSTSIPNSLDMANRLSGDFNRFAKAKTAYITNNLHPNAVYENMVPAWRANSYPGIIASLPFLKEHHLDLYANKAYSIKTIINNATTQFQSCDDYFISNKLQFKQKPRAEDPLIRNITLRHPNKHLAKQSPYLFIVQNKIVSSILFRKSHSPFRPLQYSEWIGVSPNPFTVKSNTNITINIIAAFIHQNKKSISTCKVNYTLP